MTRLTIGISEVASFSWPGISFADLSHAGRYGSALKLVDALLASPATEKIHQAHWDRCVASGSTLPAKVFATARERFCSNLRFILVHESEHTRHWQCGPPDYKSVLRLYHQTATSDAQRIKRALDELARFDMKHAYLLRHTLERALGKFLSEKKVSRVRLPNPNAKSGYEWRTVSGPKVREREFQFLARVSLFHFDELLAAWHSEIDDIFKPWHSNWTEFGALRFEKSVSPKAAAKMNIGQLGLTAHLMARLRDFTAGLGLQVYSTGQPIPTHGTPCWPIVAEFVNCALEPENLHTADSIRRTWQGFYARYKPTMQSWPKPPKPESQVQK